LIQKKFSGHRMNSRKVTPAANGYFFVFGFEIY